MSTFPRPQSVDECWVLVCAMREEAAREIAHTRGEPSRRILWGMVDALAELERRIHDGQANLHWAQPVPRVVALTPPPAPEPPADRDLQSPAPSSSRSIAPSPDRDPAHDPVHPDPHPKTYRR